MQKGLFGCAPVSPTLAVDMSVLEFMKTLFVCMVPNTTAWCNAMELFLEERGYKFMTKVSLLNVFASYMIRHCVIG